VAWNPSPLHLPAVGSNGHLTFLSRTNRPKEPSQATETRLKLPCAYPVCCPVRCPVHALSAPFCPAPLCRAGATAENPTPVQPPTSLFSMTQHPSSMVPDPNCHCDWDRTRIGSPSRLNPRSAKSNTMEAQGYLALSRRDQTAAPQGRSPNTTQPRVTHRGQTTTADSGQDSDCVPDPDCVHARLPRGPPSEVADRMSWPSVPPRR